MVFGNSTFNSGVLPGDFDNNGLYECADIDELVAQIVAGTNVITFDLTSDGFVNLADLDRWRLIAGSANLGPGKQYLNGDANLSGAVDGSDFGIWNANKFTSVAAWCSGDFNASGAVDGSDFGLWNAFKFTSSDQAAVPEPMVATWGLMAILALTIRRRWNSMESACRPPA